MASLTIRKLDDALKKRLRLRAAHNGRSMEDEARTILRRAAGEDVRAEAQAGKRRGARRSTIEQPEPAPGPGGKRALLIIGGGIAAYKSVDLIRRLRERGAAVRCILTAAAQQFITPLAAGALAGGRVFTDLFSLTDESEMGHIRLSREADLVVVAPASADLIARMAAGVADDLAGASLLASDKPILIAPAMNALMWAHPATQANLATLAAREVRRVGPNAGDLACGEVGSRRLAGP